MSVSASILIPSRGRPDYLEVTLASVAPQAADAGAEVLVINDGGGSATAEVGTRYGALVVPVPPPGGLNAARNAGIAAARGELIVLVDDDVRAPDGWLRALLDGAANAPEHDVFGGPIRAVLEGGGPRRCGREAPPITTLDLGTADRDAERVWGANMALRRRAWEAVGPFEEMIRGQGDEEDWEWRYLATGGRIRYLAAAGLEHRRTREDATLRRLVPTAFRQGRQARRYDTHRTAAPSLGSEMRVLAGCVWHIARRRCANGLVLSAHSAGRLREALSPVVAARPTPEDFLSGTSGEVWGIRATGRALVADAACDAIRRVRLEPWRLHRAASRGTRRRVLVLALERTDVPNVLAGAHAELQRSRHAVTFAAAPVGEHGKFENLNALLTAHPAAGRDWLIMLDDDVVLPRGFLDVFLFLAERFDLALAQPAHRRRSHAAWAVTRRRPGTVVRETRFVEIGPVCALRADTFDTLLPFPELRYGWGLDAHWSALAREHGWREGIVDATPIRHGLRRIASSYSREAAIAEGRAFLADRAYTPAVEAQRTLSTYQSWR